MKCTGQVCNVTCKEDEYKCGDGHCISNSFKCNGVPECIDGSDEFECIGWSKVFCITSHKKTIMCESATCQILEDNKINLKHTVARQKENMSLESILN